MSGSLSISNESTSPEEIRSQDTESTVQHLQFTQTDDSEAEEKTYKFLTGFKRTNTSTLDEERARKRQRRLLQNRQSAAASRQRKKEQFLKLQQSNDELTKSLKNAEERILDLEKALDTANERISELTKDSEKENTLIKMEIESEEVN